MDEQPDDAPVEPTAPAPTAADRPAPSSRDAYPNDRRSFFTKLFPGPTAESSEDFRKQMRELAESYGGDQAGFRKGIEERRAQRRDAPRAGKPRPPAKEIEPAPAAIHPASTEDIDGVRELISEQNEILRGILTNSIATQEDARSTAQNSRTFAWAGTAIAFLTLVATVLAFITASH